MGINKKNQMTLNGFPPEEQERLKEYALAKGFPTISKLVHNLIDKYVHMDKNTVQVVLKVPSQLRDDPERLQAWIDIKGAAIFKALARSDNAVES